eukprot:TRINITY_DN2835_c0_g1_i2.p1 TRINITY_DN2835_c0_g1~~TRINITY_DN2835_c0_g1_i2.p1  ORF type:complete len:203 (-),score=12.49 TRINITY_DN2835_c0_g1_i2:267-875(-)
MHASLVGLVILFIVIITGSAKQSPVWPFQFNVTFNMTVPENHQYLVPSQLFYAFTKTPTPDHPSAQRVDHRACPTYPYQECSYFFYDTGSNQTAWSYDRSSDFCCMFANAGPVVPDFLSWWDYNGTVNIENVEVDYWTSTQGGADDFNWYYQRLDGAPFGLGRSGPGAFNATLYWWFTEELQVGQQDWTLFELPSQCVSTCP